MATMQDFEKLDIRVGTICKVEDFPGAKKPSYKFEIDFGEKLGKKKSCGQFAANYSKDDLVGINVACVINLPPRQIGVAKSEVLTLGFPDENGDAVLVVPTKEVPLGGKLY